MRPFALALVVKDLATPLSILAAAISVIGVTAEFWRGRPYYIDALIER